MHQNRASPFASDFYRRRGYRREFRSEDHFYPFSSQKKSRFASDFLLRRGKIAHLGASKNRAIFRGAVKIAAAAAENRAILVHSGQKTREGCGCPKFLAGKVFRQISTLLENSSPIFRQREMLSLPRFGHFPARKTAAGKLAAPAGTLLDFLLRDRHSLLEFFCS